MVVQTLGRIVKIVVGIFAEVKRRRREVYLQFDVVAHSGRAEKVDQIYPRGQTVFLILFRSLFQILGPQPALARAGREP